MPSSAIRSYRYDAAQHKLHVRFLSAPDIPYIYLDVPPSLFAAMKRASSKGAFVNREIKPRCRCIRLEPSP
jgi:hypothetical protein